MKKVTLPILDDIESDQKTPLWWKGFVALAVCALLAALFWLSAYFFLAVPVTNHTLAVRQILISPFKGYSGILAKGGQIEIPHLMKIHLIPASERTISLSLPFETEEEIFGTIAIKIFFHFEDFATPEQAGIVKMLKEVSSDINSWDDFVKEKAGAGLERILDERDISLKWSGRDFEEFLAKSRLILNSELESYGINIDGLYLLDAPGGFEIAERVEGRDKVAALRQRIRLVEEKIKTELALYQSKQERLEYETNADSDDIVNSAESYRIKKDGEGDVLLAEAVAEVNRERQAILSRLPLEMQKTIAEGFEKIEVQEPQENDKQTHYLDLPEGGMCVE